MKTLDSALRDSAKTVRDASARLPDRGWSPPQSQQFARGVLVGVSAAMVVLILFAVPVMISSTTPDTSPDTVASGNNSLETPPSISAPLDDTDDPALMGEPVSDDEYRALFPDVDFVPGTAHRLASSDVPGLGLLEVYAVILNGLHPQDRFDKPNTCITSTHATVCGADLDLTELRVEGGSSCPPAQFTVLGLAEGTTLILQFTDGSEVKVAPTYGTATWGWNDAEVGLAGFTIAGANAATIAELERLKALFYPDLPTEPCN